MYCYEHPRPTSANGKRNFVPHSGDEPKLDDDKSDHYVKQDGFACCECVSPSLNRFIDRPIHLLADNGPQFLSTSFPKLCWYFDVKHLKATADHPQTS